jgi:ribosomal protein S18 acetylase RimI-like enzyme
MTIHLRPFTPSDAHFTESLIPRFSEFDLPAWRTRNEIDNANFASLKKAMTSPEPGSAIFIAEDETGKRAGFLHLQIQTDYFNGSKVAYLSDIAVDSSFEGRGVGRVLLDKAEEWAREQGCSLLTLYVFFNNLRARKIYEKLGFAEEVTKYVKPLPLNQP